jgi:hypothetical protein
MSGYSNLQGTMVIKTMEECVKTVVHEWDGSVVNPNLNPVQEVTWQPSIWDLHFRWFSGHSVFQIIHIPVH